MIRHGETEFNKENRMQGWLDAPLTEDGLKQAQALAGRFRDIPLAGVYASDLSRAAVTAQILADVQGLTAQTDPGLRELHMGTWSGQQIDDICRNDPDGIARCRAADPTWCAPGGETYPQLRQRMGETLARLAAKHEGQTIAVVSHGGGIRQILAQYKRLSWEEVRTEKIQGNTAVNLLEFDGTEVRILIQGDTSHLEATGRQSVEYAGH